jgi:hypothetical protein
MPPWVGSNRSVFAVRRCLVLAIVAGPACGRADPPWLAAAWVVGRYHAVTPDAGDPSRAAQLVGQFEFTVGGEFVARYEYCDDTPPLSGRDQWFAYDDDVIIGPIAPADTLAFPVLELTEGLVQRSETADTIVVEFASEDGPAGRVELAPGRWCIESRCGPGNVYQCP